MELQGKLTLLQNPWNPHNFIRIYILTNCFWIVVIYMISSFCTTITIFSFSYELLETSSYFSYFMLETTQFETTQWGRQNNTVVCGKGQDLNSQAWASNALHEAHRLPYGGIPGQSLLFTVSQENFPNWNKNHLKGMVAIPRWYRDKGILKLFTVQYVIKILQEKFASCPYSGSWLIYTKLKASYKIPDVRGLGKGTAHLFGS